MTLNLYGYVGFKSSLIWPNFCSIEIELGLDSYQILQSTWIQCKKVEKKLDMPLPRTASFLIHPIDLCIC